MGTVICIKKISEDKVNKEVLNTEHDEYSDELIQKYREKKMREVIQKKENVKEETTDSQSARQTNR